MAGRHRKDGPPVDEAPAEASAGPEPSAAWAGAPTALAVGPEPAPPPAPVRATLPATAVPFGASTLTAPAGVRPAPDAPSVPFGAPVGTGSAAEAAPVLPAGASARRAVREEQRRQSRRRRGVVAGALVVVVLVALVGGYKVWRNGQSTPPPAAAASRPQTTLLLAVVDSQGRTVDAVLLAHDTKGDGIGFGALVPSSLAVDSSGTGAGTFGSIPVGGPTANGDRAATALSDLVGVTVDGTWVLDSAGLAALVDAAGGVDVDVDRDVTVKVGDGVQTLASAGNQHLDGATAVAYATYLASGEPEQARLARFSEVLGALVPALPSDSAARAKLLAALGAHSSSTMKPATLSGLLGGLRADAVGNRLGFDTLPTHSLDLGTGTPTLLIDPAGTATMVSTNFADSVPAQRAGGPISVYVQNGVGTPGLAAKARTRLVVAGITYVGGGNAGRFGYARSQVLVPTGSGADGQRKGAAVAKALGLPSADVALTDQGQTIADVVVILGADFKP